MSVLVCNTEINDVCKKEKADTPAEMILVRNQAM
jgi:hypothetical protein